MALSSDPFENQSIRIVGRESNSKGTGVQLNLAKKETSCMLIHFFDIMQF